MLLEKRICPVRPIFKSFSMFLAGSISLGLISLSAHCSVIKTTEIELFGEVTSESFLHSRTTRAILFIHYFVTKENLLELLSEFIRRGIRMHHDACCAKHC